MYAFSVFVVNHKDFIFILSLSTKRNMGFTFLGKNGLSFHVLSSWRLKEKCRNPQILMKILWIYGFCRFSEKILMFPHWILTVEWKLIVSFTSFMPKSALKSTKSAFKSANNCIKIHKSTLKSINLQNPHQNPQISRILQSWSLGLRLSKVFQTKDQSEHLNLHSRSNLWTCFNYLSFIWTWVCLLWDLCYIDLMSRPYLDTYVCICQNAIWAQVHEVLF